MDSSVFNHKTFLATLTTKPGVYLMLDQENTVLYVGKAKNLKKRLASYFSKSTYHSAKTIALVEQIAQINITVTHTESEALLLENTLIKQHQPRYNILLRDDKGYPYLHLSDHPFPRLTLYRGTKRSKGHYFGPYPHAKAVYESLNLLQKIFSLRDCPDSFFRNRSRPCLQFQIKRCSGPCVGVIDENNYQLEVQHAILFLQGKSNKIIELLIEKMQNAATALEFEQAAHFRDQIAALRTLQEKQYVDLDKGYADVIAGIVENGIGCICVLNIRAGQQTNNQIFFPQHTQDCDQTALVTAFLPQYYLNQERDIPNEIITNVACDDVAILTEVINQQRNKSVHIHHNVRGTRAQWIKMAIENAQIHLAQQQPTHYRERLAALTIILQLEAMPQRLECFDISHTQGEATVASCVVFDGEGPQYSSYRRFNIRQITPGDDYAAMEQALTRRYHPTKTDTILPDILLIDGGKGQVKIAQTVLEKYQLTNIQIIGVAKGRERKAGLETLILPKRSTPLTLPKHSPALHLIQHIRDEAHRFAITGHRRQRANRQRSLLEQIEGIGPKRRRRLINHFGGLENIKRAGVTDLAAVPGIDHQLAQKIYEFFTK